MTREIRFSINSEPESVNSLIAAWLASGQCRVSTIRDFDSEFKRIAQIERPWQARTDWNKHAISSGSINNILLVLGLSAKIFWIGPGSVNSWDRLRIIDPTSSIFRYNPVHKKIQSLLQEKIEVEPLFGSFVRTALKRQFKSFDILATSGQALKNPSCTAGNIASVCTFLGVGPEHLPLSYDTANKITNLLELIEWSPNPRGSVLQLWLNSNLNRRLKRCLRLRRTVESIGYLMKLPYDRRCELANRVSSHSNDLEKFLNTEEAKNTAVCVEHHIALHMAHSEPYFATAYLPALHYLFRKITPLAIQYPWVRANWTRHHQVLVSLLRKPMLRREELRIWFALERAICWTCCLQSQTIRGAT